MRTLLKTSYNQDIRLFPFGRAGMMLGGLAAYALLLAIAWPLFNHRYALLPILLCAAPFAFFLLNRNNQGEGGGSAFWYGMLGLAVLSAPLLAGPYLISQITAVLIFAVAGTGLILLLGFAGQISLGHAAFMASGAYAAALVSNAGFGLLVSLPAAALLSAILGFIISLPSLRMRGIYLAFATYAFAFIVEEILARWKSVTGGNLGLVVDPPALALPGLSWSLENDTAFYYLCLAVYGVVLFAALNILRSSSGRAFVAVRDSELAAQSMGVNTAAVKISAFSVSAAMTGLAGALYAHFLGQITPESFTILLSINLLMMVVVGGLGALHGAVLGAIFLVVLPQIIALLRDTLPPALGGQAGLQAGLFGLIIILVVLFEPMGLHGRWIKIKAWFKLFPLYRKGSFKKQQRYMASERDR